MNKENRQLLYYLPRPVFRVVTNRMHIEDKTLESPVSGVNLAPGSFSDQLSDGPTLLVFLRFFGCIFCRETVSDLRQLSEEREDFPSVLFVSEAGETEARAFVRRYWPDARVVADPPRRSVCGLWCGQEHHQGVLAGSLLGAPPSASQGSRVWPCRWERISHAGGVLGARRRDRMESQVQALGRSAGFRPRSPIGRLIAVCSLFIMTGWRRGGV